VDVGKRNALVALSIQQTYLKKKIVNYLWNQNISILSHAKNLNSQLENYHLFYEFFDFKTPKFGNNFQARNNISVMHFYTE